MTRADLKIKASKPDGMYNKRQVCSFDHAPPSLLIHFSTFYEEFKWE